MDSFVLKETVKEGDPLVAVDFLAAGSGLSRSRIKDAMQKGAVWHYRKKKGKRLRRARAALAKGDRVALYYSRELLELLPAEPVCLADRIEYSVWSKPAGLLAQGTMYGDHCSLLRQAELFFQPRRPVFLVHRLDREAEGLMLIAHSSRMAADFSEMFRCNRIHRLYRVAVRGSLVGQSARGRIDYPLDGKEAVTEFTVTGYDPARNVSTAEVSIATGRLHQIRRHFDMLGHPVMGDPKYGSNNRNESGMQLKAVRMRFACPVTGEDLDFSLPA